MSEISAKFDEAADKFNKLEEQAEALDRQAVELKSSLRTDLILLLAASRRTGLDNGALKVYQQIRGRFPA